MPQSSRRSRLFVEPKMQGLLVFKVLLYWVNGFLTIGLLLAVWNVFTEMPRTSTELFSNMWQTVGPALLASVFLLPLIVVDCIRWSNRYAGPMVRLHQSLKALGDGENVDPVTFRKGDLWFEMAEQFNRIAAELRQRRAARSTITLETSAGESLDESGAELAEPAGV